MNIKNLENKCLKPILYSVYGNDLCGDTLQDLLSNMIAYINEIIGQTNDNTKLVQGLYDYVKNEGLSEEVSKQIQVMIDNGTFDRIINEQIFGDLEGEINKVNNSLKLLNADLTKKINDLNTTIINNKTSLDNSILGIKQSSFYVNVKDYGCVLDGVTDDTEGFKNAILSGYNVYIPKGILLFNKIEINEISDLTIFGEGIIKPNKNILNALDFLNCSNVTLSIEIDGSLQKGLGLDKNRCVHFNNCKNVKLINSKVKNAANGILIENTDTGFIKNNICYGCTGFGLSTSNIKDFIINENISFNNDYDGIKGTGIYYNIMLCNNICYNNKRDGFDFAGHYCDRLTVKNNLFFNNSLCGIEIKTLDRNIYPPNPNLTTYKFQNIIVQNNDVIDNDTSNIELANRNDILQHNVKIVNNNVKTTKSYNVNRNGMRISSLKGSSDNDVIIAYNMVDGLGFNYGVRVISSQNVTVKNNGIDVTGKGIETEDQSAVKNLPCVNISISDNIIKSLNLNCVNITDVNKAIVKNNYTQTTNTQYRINISSSATDVTQYSNYLTQSFSDKPSNVRGTIGEIAISSNMITSGCYGWICKETGSQPQWSKIGVIMD